MRGIATQFASGGCAAAELRECREAGGRLLASAGSAGAVLNCTCLFAVAESAAEVADPSEACRKPAEVCRKQGKVQFREHS